MNTISKHNKLMEFIQLYDSINIMDDVSLLNKVDVLPEEMRSELLDIIIEYLRFDMCPYLLKLNEEIGRIIATGQSNDTIKKMLEEIGGEENGRNEKQ